MSIAAAALIVALSVALSGCGSSTTTAGTPATTTQTPSPTPTTPPTHASNPAPSAVAAKPALITIKDFKYTVPASVAPGAKIQVKNLDAQNHTITSAPKGAFAVTAEAGGATVTFTAPSTPGSYKFTCDFHADMSGTLVVR